MPTCLVVIDQPAFLGLADAFTCQEIPGGTEHRLYGRVLKEVLPVTCFAGGRNSLLQEPQNIQIKIRTMNW